MKYSVLMSVWRQDNAEFLQSALESIYDRQTRKPDEIVVVFDGPLTVELYRVLEKFRSGKEPNVFYYPQEENRGLGQTLRVGTEHCTGDYIFRMDADDVSLPERFEKQIAYMEEHPDVDVLGCDIAEFDRDPKQPMRVRACPEKHEDIVRMGKRRNPMNHVSVCIKKAALVKCGSYEPVSLVEDYYLWLKMIVDGCKLANLNEALVCVRVGNGFYARRSAKDRVGSWKILQKFMRKHGMISRIDAAINMICIVGFTCCSSGVRKIVYDKLLRR